MIRMTLRPPLRTRTTGWGPSEATRGRQGQKGHGQRPQELDFALASSRGWLGWQPSNTRTPSWTCSCHHFLEKKKSFLVTGWLAEFVSRHSVTGTTLLVLPSRNQYDGYQKAVNYYIWHIYYPNIDDFRTCPQTNPQTKGYKKYCFW